MDYPKIFELFEKNNVAAQSRVKLIAQAGLAPNEEMLLATIARQQVSIEFMTTLLAELHNRLTSLENNPPMSAFNFRN